MKSKFHICESIELGAGIDADEIKAILRSGGGWVVDVTDVPVTPEALDHLSEEVEYLATSVDSEDESETFWSGVVDTDSCLSLVEWVASVTNSDRVTCALVINEDGYHVIPDLVFTADEIRTFC